MTNPSFVLEEAYEVYRPLMYTIAYRMLASAAEAEDVVQDIFTEMADRPDKQITHLKAYLAKAVTNRCISLLKSARVARMSYPGPWLPEPEVEEQPGIIAGRFEPEGREPTPEEKAISSENVSYAMLVAMEKLNPVERAVFILKETLGYSYREIAEFLGKSEAASRQNGSRAMKKLSSSSGPAGQKETPDGSISGFRVRQTDGADSENRLLAEIFLQGARTGDFSSLISKLSIDARLYSDGGGKVRAALNPIYGKERILLFLEGVGKKDFFAEDVHPVRVSGQLGLAKYAGGKLKWTICWSPPEPDGQIAEIYIVVNPAKLG